MTTFIPTGLTTIVAAFILSAGLTAVLLRLTLRLPWLARPSSGRLHVAPTPLWGGVAIFISFAGVALLRNFFNSREGVVVVVPSTLIFLMGLFDDVFHLQPRWKLLGQILCALGPLLLLSQHPLTGSRWIDTLLGLLWIVGITNAFNLLDNINGLAGGTALLVGAFQAVRFFAQGQSAYALLSLGLCGALLGFLLFNFPKGRIFMGDSGSLFIGFWLAAATLVGVPVSGSRSGAFMFPLLLMVIPICDTTLVTLTRILRGRPVSVGGTDHLSHRLVAYGLSRKSAVLFLWTFSLISGVLGVSTLRYGVSTLLAAVMVLVVGTALFGTYLTRFELKTQPNASGSTSIRRPHIPAWIRMSSRAFLDAFLIVASYYTAYLLRFNTQINRSDTHFLVFTLVELLAIKLAVLIALGAYKPSWDYFGLKDAYRLVGISIVGSLAAVTYFSIAYRFAGFSRIVFALDFLVFTMLALIFRFSFRLFDDIAPKNHRTNMLIYGADSAGETALQIASKQYPFKVVGFIDDDRARRTLSIHSVPVRGSSQELPALIKQFEASVVLVTTSTSDETRNALAFLCKSLGVKLLSLRVSLDEVDGVVHSFSSETAHTAVLVENESTQPSLTVFSKAVSS